MKIAKPTKIKILKPINLLENISKNKPPEKAFISPKQFSLFSKRFQIITEHKIRFGTQPIILK